MNKYCCRDHECAQGRDFSKSSLKEGTLGLGFGKCMKNQYAQGLKASHPQTEDRV